MSLLCHLYSPLSSLPSLLCLPSFLVLCVYLVSYSLLYMSTYTPIYMPTYIIVVSLVMLTFLYMSYARLHVPCQVRIFCLLALLPS